MRISWWDNGQTSLSNRIFRQLRINIGRFEFGWDQPFRPYMYKHDKYSLSCCGGMGVECEHEEMSYLEIEESINAKL